MAVPATTPQPRTSRLAALRRWPKSQQIALGCGLWIVLVALSAGVLGMSSTWLAALIGIPAGLGVCALLVRRGFHPSTVAVIALAMAVYACYVGYTSHGERNFDVEHQVKYIQYIVAHHRPPPSDHCFICHHPPLYYGSSAVVYSVSKALGLASPLRAVQMLSLACMVLFSICAAATLRRCTSNPWIVSLGCFLASLWPYTIIHSARVHNDVMALALMSWTIYACVRFYQAPSRRWLVGALALASLSVLTKTNGYVVLALVVVTVVARCWWPDTRKPQRRAMLAYAIPLCVVAAVALGGFARSRGARKPPAPKTQDPVAAQATDNDAPAMTERLLGSAAKIGERAWMHNEPYNYMYFDVREFLEQPYIMAQVDNVGRQLYFNHLLKSSLFSTHNEHPDAETSYRVNRRLASILNFLLLLLCGYVLYYALLAQKSGVRRHFVLVAAFFGLLAGGMLFRILVPHTHHSDFRHIFPILLPFCVAYALAVEHHLRNKSFLGTVGLGLAGSFVGLTLLYFAPKYRWIQQNSPVKWTEVYAHAVSRWVKAGTNWNQKGNQVLEGTDGLRVKLSAKPNVDNVAISLDNNDKYQITLVGARKSRTFELGPHPDNKPGMAEYVHTVSPPVQEVSQVLVRPLLGDHAYSVGHLIVNHRAGGRPGAPAPRKPSPVSPPPRPGPAPGGAAVPGSPAPGNAVGAVHGPGPAKAVGDRRSGSGGFGGLSQPPAPRPRGAARSTRRDGVSGTANAKGPSRAPRQGQAVPAKKTPAKHKAESKSKPKPKRRKGDRRRR